MYIKRIKDQDLIVIYRKKIQRYLFLHDICIYITVKVLTLLNA